MAIMHTVIRAAFALGMFTLVVPAGINWKTIWLEPNPIILQAPGSFARYVVKGINGGDTQADLTHSPHLKISSSDENIVFVDRESARLIAKAPGQVKIRISFSECISLITATVLDPSKNSK